jgi:hypothetical protein
MQAERTAALVKDCDPVFRAFANPLPAITEQLGRSRLAEQSDSLLLSGFAGDLEIAGIPNEVTLLAPPPPGKCVPGSTTYQVVEDDLKPQMGETEDAVTTIVHVSQKCGVSVAGIARLNKVTGSTAISEGTVLLLPPAVSPELLQSHQPDQKSVGPASEKNPAPNDANGVASLLGAAGVVAATFTSLVALLVRATLQAGKNSS